MICSPGLKIGLVEVEWPGPQFFERQGWIFSLQLLASLFLVTVILRNRKRMKEAERLNQINSENWSIDGFFSSNLGNTTASDFRDYLFGKNLPNFVRILITT